jgi:hypothetical protein
MPTPIEGPMPAKNPFVACNDKGRSMAIQYNSKWSAICNQAQMKAGISGN